MFPDSISISKFYSFCCILLIFNIIQAKGQEKKQKDSVEAAVAKVISGAGIHNLGIAVFQERNIINRNYSIFYGAGAYNSFFSGSFPPVLGARFINVNDNRLGEDYSVYNITPFLIVELRRYITLANKGYAGNQLYANSGSYLGISGEVPLGNDFLSDIHPRLELAAPAGVKVGLRRSISQKIVVDSNVGVMAKIGRENILAVPRINLWLAYIF